MATLRLAMPTRRLSPSYCSPSGLVISPALSVRVLQVCTVDDPHAMGGSEWIYVPFRQRPTLLDVLRRTTMTGKLASAIHTRRRASHEEISCRSVIVYREQPRRIAHARTCTAIAGCQAADFDPQAPQPLSLGSLVRVYRTVLSVNVRVQISVLCDFD
ncbi:hypothetical protein PYCCODRAFT_175983 [Trametes coccinea BRFM310]|uniref:Uncharacterized protein n=1 Tax=Trametes coccinea (strain BRFM310) TaxID=1353009 RepID=A0A1Y2ISK7_TRAC3|nr:hypothetical protein PYCCODRAFT_175983 [Trametes coccinea BRFM310]